jgi:uncharacterized membrane protein
VTPQRPQEPAESAAQGDAPLVRSRHELIVLAKARRHVQDRAADRITAFAGSMPFVYLHVVWFTVWIAFNTGSHWTFDPYPYGLLTLVVSLEAIFLSTFVMLSQNREALRADIRAEIDFETNVMSEVWLEAMADRLGIDIEHVHTLAGERMAAAKVRQDQAVTGP